MVYRALPLLLGLLLVAGCSPTVENPRSSVTDDLGRTVSIQEPARRVVSLAPNLTELVYAAGAGSSLVAVTPSASHPPPVDTLPTVSALPIDFEAVAAREPDLVVATDQINSPGDAKTFEALNIPIYYFSFETLDDIPSSLQRMGQLLGTETAAADSADALRREIERLSDRTEARSQHERPRVLVLVGDETLYSFGEGSYVHTLVDLAGGRSITKDIENQAPTLSDEFVLSQEPDVIVGLWGRNYDPARLLELHPTWDVVPAIRNDRVYSLPPSLIARPGPRVVEGAWRMAHRLHPDLVSVPPAARARTPNSPKSSQPDP